MSKVNNIELIKKLRSTTGAGLSDVKEALESNNYDETKALEFLKAKGLARAAKRSDREAKEGIVSSYIHNTNKVGVLVEVNCETDFVAKSEDFVEFAKNIALQIAAMNPKHISKDDISEEIINSIRDEVENSSEHSKKPQKVKDQIALSKVQTYSEEYCLLEQKFFKDGKTKISDMLSSISSKLGEKIEISRFSLYRIG